MKFRIDPEYSNTIIDWGENCDNLLKGGQFVVDLDFIIPSDSLYFHYRYDQATDSIVSQQQTWIDSLSSHYRIYDFMSDSTDVDFLRAPYDQNYDILGLYKDYTFDKGELKTVVYYSHYDYLTEQFSDPVVTESRTYYRRNDYYFKREINITWHRRDGSLGQSKTTLKTYTAQQAIAAGTRRRTYIVDQLKIQIAFMIANTEQIDISQAEQMGKALLKDYRDQIWDYKQGDTQGLITGISGESGHAWLDNPIDPQGTTIRQFALAELSI